MRVRSAALSQTQVNLADTGPPARCTTSDCLLRISLNRALVCAIVVPSSLRAFGFPHLVAACPRLAFPLASRSPSEMWSHVPAGLASYYFEKVAPFSASPSGQCCERFCPQSHRLPSLQGHATRRTSTDVLRRKGIFGVCNGSSLIDVRNCTVSFRFSCLT